jgi:plasmid stability protein
MRQEPPMGQLTVRKVDEEIIRRLKIRAAEHGRSAEAEHREILKQALLPDTAAEDFWALANGFGKRPDRCRVTARTSFGRCGTSVERTDRCRCKRCNEMVDNRGAQHPGRSSWAVVG